LYSIDKKNNHTFDDADFGNIAAHEFGHALGIDDLYNKPKLLNKFSNLEVGLSLMGHQWLTVKASNYDMEKALTAFMKNSFQYWG